jgi:hypothetical protein
MQIKRSHALGNVNGYNTVVGRSRQRDRRSVQRLDFKKWSRTQMGCYAVTNPLECHWELIPSSPAQGAKSPRD